MKNKFSNPRPSMLEDTDDGQLEDIDVIPNEEMILVCGTFLLSIGILRILVLMRLSFTFRHLVKKVI